MGGPGQAGVRIGAGKPRRREPPGGRRAIVVAATLSLLMPGLGHVYLGRFARALIWFGGSLLIAAILREGDVDRWIPLVMLTVLGLAAAGDAWMLIRMRSRGR